MEGKHLQIDSRSHICDCSNSTHTCCQGNWCCPYPVATNRGSAVITAQPKPMINVQANPVMVVNPAPPTNGWGGQFANQSSAPFPGGFGGQYVNQNSGPFPGGFMAQNSQGNVFGNPPPYPGA